MVQPHFVKIEHPFHEDYCWDGVLMTTSVSIIASDQRFLAKRAAEYMATLAKALDFFDPNSELSLLNRTKGRVKVSPLLYRVLLLAKILEIKTNRTFRVDFEGMSLMPEGEHGFSVDKYPYVYIEKDTVINLGGIAKGFIVDRTFAYIRRNGTKNILVNEGGDIRCQSQERPWKIGLLNPLDKAKPFGVIKLKAGALVTSGISQRSRGDDETLSTHFFDTQSATFYKETPFVIVTVQGRWACVSEVLAKCLLIGKQVELKPPYKALGVRADYKVRLFDTQGNVLEQTPSLYK